MKQQPKMRFSRIAREVKQYINERKEYAEMLHLESTGNLHPLEFAELAKFRKLFSHIGGE